MSSSSSINSVLCLVLLLGLFVTLGSCQFKISVVQNNITASPVEFILYCNQTIAQSDQRYEDLIWAVGSLSKAPSRSDLLLHNGGGLAGLSASVQVGDQTFYEGPVLAREHTYWYCHHLLRSLDINQHISYYIILCCTALTLLQLHPYYSCVAIYSIMGQGAVS
jgi:hypothetical protein